MLKVPPWDRPPSQPQRQEQRAAATTRPRSKGSETRGANGKTRLRRRRAMRLLRTSARAQVGVSWQNRKKLRGPVSCHQAGSGPARVILIKHTPLAVEILPVAVGQRRYIPATVLLFSRAPAIMSDILILNSVRGAPLAIWRRQTPSRPLRPPPWTTSGRRRGTSSPR